MLAKSKSHFLFTARECVRLIKIIDESSQGAKNPDQLFFYTFWHIWFLLFHQKSASSAFIPGFIESSKHTILKVRNSLLKCGQNHRITKYGAHRVPITGVNATFSDEHPSNRPFLFSSRIFSEYFICAHNQ